MAPAFSRNCDLADMSDTRGASRFKLGRHAVDLCYDDRVRAVLPAKLKSHVANLFLQLSLLHGVSHEY